MSERYTPVESDYIRTKGGKQYLPVANRVQWMRGEHADWSIDTAVIALGWVDGYAIMRAEVRDGEGRLIGAGTKSETRAGFADFIEKAETGAVGRALARAGYGTEDGLDLEGERYADAPVTKPAADSEASPPPAATHPRTAEEDALLNELVSLVTSHAQLTLLADAVQVPKGRRANAGELRAMIEIARKPAFPPTAWPEPGTAAFLALTDYERGAALAWHEKRKKETPTDVR